MNQDEWEQVWTTGFSAAMTRIVQEAFHHLPAGDKEKAALLSERTRAIAVLRQVCALRGDNNWPDDLDLADIIEKHLLRHLVQTG